MNETDETVGFRQQLQQAPDLRTALALFDTRSAALFDHILFTALRFDHDERVMTRLYSNREAVSPTGGTKPIPSGPWADCVIWSGKPYIGLNRLDLKAVFFDYEALWAEGCGSVMNIPVTRNGVTVGSFNILGREGQYDVDDAARFSTTAELAGSYFVSCDKAGISE
ncbi:GAF domain-containing protein [Rhizobium sp. AU243]|uniref:GAF domain-containing protein n=1 Tax=Rhizobium sp. AU243 TaxID=2303425 RepID=UPI0010CC3537|nr:GAF domain-containing protein [Rhizobium sp. AU243]TKV70785.1 GAF domain-containing protein [Rhizobium sp. AU243]